MATTANSNNKRREEYFVASLVLNGPQLIKANWSPILQQLGLSVSIAGIFCHGRPQVKWDVNWASGTVELADLLIVIRTRRNRADDWNERACLIQAKMADHSGQLDLGSQSSTSNNNYKQLCLYTTWPPFNFTSPPLDTSTMREFSDKSGGQTGYYSTISQELRWPEDLVGWIGGCPWAVPKNAHGSKPSQSLGGLMIKMLDGKAGKSLVKSDKAKRSTWSGTIDEVLKQLASAKLKAGPYSNASRVNDVLCFMTDPAPELFKNIKLLAESGEGNDGGGDQVSDTSEAVPEGGYVPTLLIEVGPAEA
jgi:hypothetical protein